MDGESESKAVTTNNPTQKTTKDIPSTLTDKTLSGVANLIKLLPTGTVFLFQFLSPIFTNSGHCSTINKYLTAFLLLICSISCCFSCFTDSYTGKNGKPYYGVATKNGLWVFQTDPDAGSVDLSSYKLKFGDFAHAFFSVIVFGVVALLDPNTVDCFYPKFESDQKALIMALPAVVGFLSTVVFAVFPNQRHGIGYSSKQAYEDK